jgi:multisubunit Na+/H+ antiporter MnhG subunit
MVFIGLVRIPMFFSRVTLKVTIAVLYLIFLLQGTVVIVITVQSQRTIAPYKNMWVLYFLQWI